MDPLPRALAAVVVAALSCAPGCILSPLDLEGRPCPCAPGWTCVADVCYRGCTDRSDCVGTESCVGGRCLSIDAGPPCMPSTETCNGRNDDCDGATDEGSGLCSRPEATASCRSGACVIDACNAGYEDCNDRADDGCETPLGTTDDCAGCGDACTGTTRFCAPAPGGGLACSESCPSGLDECGGACVDTDVNRLHCGGCDQPCSPAHGTGICRTGVCAINVCDTRWADCDDDVATGCEVSLDADRTCGSCTNDCTGGVTGSCSVGRCVGGSCMMVAGSPGDVCRPAVSLCDLPETCDAAGNCPPDRVQTMPVACREPTCGGLDPRETCDGVSATCPPPCGCADEPCCTTPMACNVGLECRMGTCRACTAGPIMLSGGFPMPAGASPVVRSVVASGGSITFSDAMSATGTVMLGTGITASGMLTSPCPGTCAYINSIVASGSTLTLTATAFMGTPTMATITLTGATATGSFTAAEISATIPGYLTTVAASGDTITLTDQGGTPSTIRLTRTATCP